MAIKIFINTDLKDLTANVVANKNRPTQVVRLPQIVEGETLNFELSLVNSNGGYDSRSGDDTVDLAIGVSAKGSVATSGTFTLTAATETTAAIAYNASAQAVEDALNALNSNTGAFGSLVAVTKLAAGSYRVIFADPGARTEFGGTSVNLAPESEVTAATAVVGDSTTRAQQVIQISQQPAIYTETFTTHANKFLGSLNANTARVQEFLSTGLDAYFEVKVDTDVICQVPVSILPAVAAPNSLPAHTLPNNLDAFAADPSTNGSFNAANWLTDLGSPQLYAIWGNITGTLSNQADLVAEFLKKAFNKIDLGGGLSAYIGGDQTGNTRGQDSLDIQSKRSDNAQVASAVNAIAVGLENQVDAENATCFGENNVINNTAIDSNVVGRENIISGLRTVAVGSILTTGNGNDNNILIGRTVNVSADNSIGIGDDIIVNGSQSVGLGYQCIVNGNNAVSIGHNVKAPANVGEFGVWDKDQSTGTITRGGSVRCSNLGNANNPHDGFVALSVNDSDRSPLDGGTVDGNESAIQLPREMASIRRNGDEVLIDVNIGGIVKSVSMGDATRACQGNQASCRKPLGAAIQNIASDSVTIKTMSQLTQAQYDAITPDVNTVYIIVG